MDLPQEDKGDKEREMVDKNYDFSIPEVRELQQICAIAEEKMEKYWSKKIVQAQDARSALSDFLYYLNYKKLTDLEYYLLLSHLPQLQKVLFLGSGALPLTAILLAGYGVKSVLIERDQEAFMLATQLIKKLGLEHMIELVLTDVMQFSSEEHFDAVWMASLLFTSADADRLLAHLVAHCSFEVVLIRTVEGMRQLLYQQVPLALVKKYLTLELELHPKNEILNSILLCTKP